MMDEDKSWHGKIITNSGATFDIQKPRVEMLEINDIAHALSMLCRYNGHVPAFYSVAEHSVRVAQWLENQGQVASVCLAGLLHDAAEAYIGDMVNPMKQIPDLGVVFRAYENTIDALVAEKWRLSYPLHEMVKEADHQVYKWEVEYVRSGFHRGWPAYYAETEFLSFFVRYGGYK